MFPGMNKRAIEAAMKKMGVKQEEIDAKEVIIKLEDKELVIKNPNVSRVEMMGQETFQISGEIEEREIEKYKDHQKREKELFLYWFLVQERLNNRPRKSLNYLTPNEAAAWRGIRAKLEARRWNTKL